MMFFLGLLFTAGMVSKIRLICDEFAHEKAVIFINLLCSKQDKEKGKRKKELIRQASNTIFVLTDQDIP